MIELGLNHEQQHQELILTDIKHTLSQNPLRPAYRPDAASPLDGDRAADGMAVVPRRITMDRPRGRRVRLRQRRPAPPRLPRSLPARLAAGDERGVPRIHRRRRLHRPELWLSDGWNVRQRREAGRPRSTGSKSTATWWTMTLGGFRPSDRVGAGLPRELLRGRRLRPLGRRPPADRGRVGDRRAATRNRAGNFLESGHFHPRAADGGTELAQCFGDVWEWTQSPYTPYPGLRPAAGALGEYNAKFMCNQLVLRGGSCATPASHIRSNLPKFLPPRGSLAVHRNPTGERRMTPSTTTICRHERDDLVADSIDSATTCSTA